MAYVKKKEAKVIGTPSVKEKPAVRQISLNEFRAWLSGVEEMQAEDWHPDLTQWRIIREKIDLIIIKTSRQQNTEDDDQEEVQPRRRVQFEGPSSIASVMMPPGGPPSAFSLTAEGALKTPSLDTSAGGYASNLE